MSKVALFYDRCIKHQEGRSTTSVLNALVFLAFLKYGITLFYFMSLEKLLLYPCENLKNIITVYQVSVIQYIKQIAHCVTMLKEILIQMQRLYHWHSRVTL